MANLNEYDAEKMSEEMVGALRAQIDAASQRCHADIAKIREREPWSEVTYIKVSIRIAQCTVETGAARLKLAMIYKDLAAIQSTKSVMAFPWPSAEAQK